MISGRETMIYTGNRACARKSEMFSLMVLLNVVQRSFFKCAIYMDYAMAIMLLSCLCCCLESQRAFTVACGVPQDLYVKDVVLSLNLPTIT